jgi:hypothetical protein
MWSIGETCQLLWKGDLEQLCALSTRKQTPGDTGAEHIEFIFKLLWASPCTDEVQLFVLGGGAQSRLSSITFPSVPVTPENFDPKELRFQVHPQTSPTAIRDFVLIPPSRPENILTLQNEIVISPMLSSSTQVNVPFSLLPPITHSHLLTIDRGDRSRLSVFISEAEVLPTSIPLGGMLHTENSADIADPRRVKVRSYPHARPNHLTYL